MRVNLTTLKHKKRVIKWENILFIPIMIFAVSGIVKSNPQFITISIVQHIIISTGIYYTVKITRLTIQKKGLLKAIVDFVNFK